MIGPKVENYGVVSLEEVKTWGVWRPVKVEPPWWSPEEKKRELLEGARNLGGTEDLVPPHERRDRSH